MAELKGAVLSIASHATIVDMTHAVASQDILEGALVLRQATSAFPAQSIHVAVVDPGVGTDRRILLATIGGSHFIAPDNGLLTLVMDQRLPEDIRQIDRPEFWRQPVSRTFPGRDIMGPVAAHLAMGRSPADLASPLLNDPVRLEVRQPHVVDRIIEGSVISIDSFGNLVTNIHESHLSTAASPIRTIIQAVEVPIVRTYTDGSPGEALALIGSSGWLEIAVNGGNAAESLRIGRGESVRLVW